MTIQLDSYFLYALGKLLIIVQIITMHFNCIRDLDLLEDSNEEMEELDGLRGTISKRILQQFDGFNTKKQQEHQ